MNTGGSWRQRHAQQSRMATAPLTLEPRPAVRCHNYALTGLPGLGLTAALALQVSPDQHPSPARVHRERCLSKARS